jgi:uncharacterized iron-regulated membrane protein
MLKRNICHPGHAGHHFALRRWLLAALSATLLTLPVSSMARSEPDQDRARAALQAGEILPLNTILTRLAQTQPGQVLEVELERKDGRWLYEIKLLQPGGGLRKLELDARSGEVLQPKSRGTDARPDR